ncbi:hypothetical protein PENTCL1PPCAC_16909, partial [Pristionchus entomophagus]
MSDDELPLLIHGLHNFLSIWSIFFDALFLLCVYEILTSIALFIIFPRVIPLGTDAIVVAIEGPCRLLPVRSCYACYSVLLNGIGMFNIQTTSCFLFRYKISSIRQTISYNTMLVIPAVIFTAILNFGIDPREILDPLLIKHVPQYDLVTKALGGITDPLHSPALPSIVWINVTASQCFFLNVWAGLSIRRSLDRNSNSFSSRTQKVHREFLSVCVY